MPRPNKEKTPAMISAVPAPSAPMRPPAPTVRPSSAGRRRSTDNHSFDSEQTSVASALAEASRGVAEALNKATRHFRGEEIWVIGTMPDCAPALDAVERQIQRIVANSQFSSQQVEAVAARLKDVSDLRAAARTARQGVQLAWLLRQRGVESSAYPLILPVAEIACRVAAEAAESLVQGNASAARHAALHYRSVDEARSAGEVRAQTASGQGAEPLLTRRLTLASIWFMAVGGEAFARVAARAAVRSATASPGTLHTTL